MIEGWHNNDYLILSADRDEAIQLTERYGIAEALPGYTLIGVKSWDDFILQNSEGRFFTVPTVPLEPAHVRPLVLDVEPSVLRPDQRLAGKIKWFIKPVIFGGSPSDESNTTWISLDEHIAAVKWWNQFYWDVKRKKPST